MLIPTTLGVPLVEWRDLVSKCAGFHDTARRVVFRVEVQHQPLPAIILKGDEAPCFRPGQREAGSWHARFQEFGGWRRAQPQHGQASAEPRQEVAHRGTFSIPVLPYDNAAAGSGRSRCGNVSAGLEPAELFAQADDFADHDEGRRRHIL